VVLPWSTWAMIATFRRSGLAICRVFPWPGISAVYGVKLIDMSLRRWLALAWFLLSVSRSR